MVETSGFLALAAVVGVLVGWGLSLISLGSKIQREKEAIARNKERVDEQDKKIAELTQKLDDLNIARASISQLNSEMGAHASDIAELRAAIKDVLNLFKLADGEPRFITRPACLGMQQNCHELSTERDIASKVRFGNLEKSIADLRDAQESNLALLINEIRKVQA